VCFGVLADKSAPSIQKKNVGGIASERLLWAMRPLGAVVLILWVMNPDTTAKADLQYEALLGFLFGAIYGIFYHHDILREILFTKRQNVRHVKNRLPDEFYWGKKLNVLFKKD